jgi:hypothetical protein
MRLSNLAWLSIALAAWAWGCDSSLLFGDDDDGDDDDSQGIVTDDDDDDDDDSEADDDDSEADDDTTPPTPALNFTVTGGELDGFHTFPHLWCGYDEEDGYWLLQGGTDTHWGEGFMMAIHHEPFGDEHVEDMQFGWWGGDHGWAEASGSADCFLDLVDPLPAASGTFQCAAMLRWQSGQEVYFEVSDGVVQCP